MWVTSNRSFVRVAETTRGRHRFHDNEEMEVSDRKWLRIQEPDVHSDETFIKLVPDGK